MTTRAIMKYLQCELDTLRATIANQQDRMRRIVRVHWQVRCGEAIIGDYPVRRDAWREAKACGLCRVYRITARRCAPCLAVKRKAP